MASNINHLRKTFYKLGTPQKLEFIERLNAQEGTKKLPEYSHFLMECIRVYQDELAAAEQRAKESKVKRKATTSKSKRIYARRPTRGESNRIASPYTRSYTARSFAVSGAADESFKLAKTPDKYIVCANCKARLGSFARICTECGKNPMVEIGEDGKEELPSYTVYTSTPIVNTDADSYTGLLHSYGKSPMFLMGIILWAVGSLLGILFNFSVFSIISILLLVLPVIGLFMLYSASVKPKFPEKSLTSMMLFEISATIQLILLALGAVVAVIGFGALIIASLDNLAMVAGIVISFITSAVVLAAYIYFYFISLFRVLRGIRNGITQNDIKPLRGVVPFVLVSFLLTGISVLDALVLLVARDFVASSMSSLVQMLPASAMPFVADFFPGSGVILIFNLFVTLVAAMGLVMCLVTLWQFNENLRKQRG